MNCEIVLYKDCELKIEKNYYIDDGLATYLNSLSHLFLNDVQYIKNQLDLLIKLDFNQDVCDQIVNQQNYNYMAISNKVSGGLRTTYYYFIIGKTWKGQNTVQFELHMDVLATFKLGTAYIFNDRTLVHREHKDRFSQNRSTKNDNGWKLVKNIDLHAEGINPLLYRTYNRAINNDSNNYYILYRSKTDTQEGVNPVDAFLYTDKNETYNNPLIAVGATPSGQITLPPEGQAILFKYDTTLYNTGKITYKLNGAPFDEIPLTIYKEKPVECVIIEREGNEVYIFVFHPAAITITKGKYTDFAGIDINNGYIIEKYNYGTIVPDVSAFITKYVNNAAFYNVWTSSKIVIPKASQIDLTDPRNIKLIKYPYAPESFTLSDPLVGGNVELLYREGIRIINPLKLGGSNLDTIYHPDRYVITNISIINNATPKSIEYESKMLHSEFYLVKFLYDNFSTQIQYELFATPERYENKMWRILFVPSSTINSRFLFSLVDYDFGSTVGSITDYPKIIAVARNNEMVLLNNSYINYVKSGFNYDVKSKNRQETVNWVTTGVSAVGAIASFASSAFVGGVGIAAGITLATSTAAGIFKTIESNKQAEQNISARLDQLRLQSTAVSGSDDVDLMSYYCTNKLYISIWEPSEKFKHVIWDLFYYCGYISQEQKTPQTNTRKLFNFLQCSPILDVQDGYYIPGDIQDEICRRWGMGVFIFHNNGNAIDFSFLYENWETWLN